MLNLLFARLIMSLLASSALIGLILLLKKILTNHISTKWQYNMRFLFIVVLILPFVPIRYFDFGRFYGLLFENAAANGGIAAVSIDKGIGNVIGGVAAIQDLALSVNRVPEYLELLFIGMWLIGVFVYAVITFICNRKIMLIKKGAKPIENGEIAEAFEQCKASLSITRNIVFCESGLVQTPMAVGIIKTYVVLPSKIIGQMPVSALKYAILHELWHYKNKDLLFNYIMCFLQILYWFNPIVYLAFKEIRTDSEIACDAAVLETLDKGSFINYGMTIIGFAEKLSRPVTPLTLAADMAGSKKQITKRIEKIASFKEDSMRLKIKSIGVFIIIGFLVLTQIPVISVMAFDKSKYNFSETRNTAYEDLSGYFDGFEGSFVLYDLQKDKYSIYNKEKSVTRVSPDSTYKIYSALAALELNIIQDGNSTLSWDGKTYPIQQWNKDHDLFSAMKDSVSWYFQDIDKLSGLKNLQKYFKDIGYGNYDLSGGISNFWIESSLLISPVEQVQILKKFYFNELPFKKDNINTVKGTIKLSEKDGVILSGKTGTGSVNGNGVNGWFVGYVESEGNLFIFAANIQGKDFANGNEAARITLSILEDKDIYKE